MEEKIKLLGMGPFWDELSVGDRYRTVARTLTETDLVNFINLSWLTEELFTNTLDRKNMAIKGRVVPTGLAFLNATLDVKGPTFVGDTIHVECTVIEVRETSKGNHGLVRTENKVVNQKGETVLVYNPLRMMKGSKGGEGHR
jgi:hypothetical protein